MGAQQSREPVDRTDDGVTTKCMRSGDEAVQLGPRELQQQAETGVFSDSESDRCDLSESEGDAVDTDEEGGVWMVLPSALSSTGQTFRKIETQVNEEEQLELVKRKARAAKKLARKRVKDAVNSDANDKTVESGDVISPRDFQHIKMLGVGGMGQVMLVRHQRDGKLYAMKVVSKTSVREKNMAARVLSERDVLGGTSHHALVHLYWAFQTTSNLYFVMEYCPGGELSTHLGRVKKFTEKVAAFYAAELVLAVQQLHQHGILHRDLKPENMLLTEDGHLKLVDFGISKFGVTEATRGAMTICGSYEYLAPEILAGEEYGTAADWWAFGAVLYELLTGLPPWYSHNPKDMCKQILYAPFPLSESVSLDAEDLLRKLLNRNPGERLGSRGGSYEIMEHTFFRHIDWEMVAFREVQPPIQPCDSPETIVDCSNFRDEFTKISLGNTDKSCTFSESFKGFNFQAPEDQHIEYGYARGVSLDKL